MIAKRIANVVKRLLAPREGPIILMYHRVGAPACDPERLAVTADNLARQIAVLKAHRTVVPLDWLAKRRESGLSVARTAVVTFDDGYADVFHNGLPVLARLDCPATIFVATGTIGAVTNMWWDVVARLVLTATRLPPELTLALDGAPRRIQVDAAAPRSRAKAYATICDSVRSLPSAVRDDVVEGLARQIWGTRDDLAADRIMSPDEILRWYRKGVFDIGAHTVTHPSLPALSAGEQLREIEACRRACAALTGEAPTALAYPYGHHDTGTLSAARAAGITAGVTAEKRKVSSADHPLMLPRYFVGNWDETEFARALSL